MDKGHNKRMKGEENEGQNINRTRNRGFRGGRKGGEGGGVGAEIFPGFERGQ